jgi:hypothetical protein
MRRRQFVAALPLATGLAGCSAESDRSASTGPPTRDRPPEATETATATAATETATATAATETATASTADDPLPSVSTVLRASYRHVVNTDGIDVTAPNRAQFAFVYPPADELGRQPEAFALELGDRRIEPAQSVEGFDILTPGVPSVYTDEHREGALRFDVPTVETDSAALVVEGRRYPLSASDVEELASAPDLSLSSVSVPESVPADASIELGVTATNDGDREGIFLAGFRHSGLPKTIDVTVPAGETVSKSIRYDVFYDEGSMYFDFDYPSGDRNYEVAIDPASVTPEANDTPDS